MERRASATWRGGFKDGRGEISSASGAISGTPYSAPTRFGDEKGTNPEELIGAAHAGCFSMALSKSLIEHDIVPERIDTEARVRLERGDDGYSITRVRLETRVEAPDADPATFEKAATGARDGCPVSRALNADVELSATLVN